VRKTRRGRERDAAHRPDPHSHASAGGFRLCRAGGHGSARRRQGGRAARAPAGWRRGGGPTRRRRRQPAAQGDPGALGRAAPAASHPGIRAMGGALRRGRPRPAIGHCLARPSRAPAKAGPATGRRQGDDGAAHPGSGQGRGGRDRADFCLGCLNGRYPSQPGSSSGIPQADRQPALKA